MTNAVIIGFELGYSFIFILISPCLQLLLSFLTGKLIIIALYCMRFCFRVRVPVIFLPIISY